MPSIRLSALAGATGVVALLAADPPPTATLRVQMAPVAGDTRFGRYPTDGGVDPQNFGKPHERYRLPFLNGMGLLRADGSRKPAYEVVRRFSQEHGLVQHDAKGDRKP